MLCGGFRRYGRATRTRASLPFFLIANHGVSTENPPTLGSFGGGYDARGRLLRRGLDALESFGGVGEARDIFQDDIVAIGARSLAVKDDELGDREPSPRLVYGARA